MVSSYVELLCAEASITLEGSQLHKGQKEVLWS